jgi:threonine synthase
MVKKHSWMALKHHNLTSANSINIARWLPLSVLFLFFTKHLENKIKLWFSLPSGNWGMFHCGYHHKKWVASGHFVASTNVNDTVPRFLENGF